MAKLKEPQDLTLISVRSVPGLVPEDLEELRTLHITNLQSLMDAMDTVSGKLHELSNGDATIEPDQAKRIGDCLVAFETAPEGWRKRWTMHAASIPTASDSTPITTVSVIEPWYNRGFIGWISGK